MTHRALVIDDDPDVREMVADILESLGHEHDVAVCQEEARRLLASNRYSYYLLDLEIPVKAARGFPRIQNGENLLAEIVAQRGPGREPILVITSHGKDSPNLAVRMMKLGADDFITKPFATVGRTLDQAILEALAGRPCRPARNAEPGSGEKPSPFHAFSGREMVFRADRIELCEVKIISDRGTGQSMMLLGELRRKDRIGRYVRRSAEELARAIDARGGVGTITGCVATIRKNITERLRAQLGVLCGPDDVLAHDEQGYYLREWILVRDAAEVDALAEVRVSNPGRVPARPRNVPGDVPTNLHDVPAEVSACVPEFPAIVPDAAPAEVPLNERQRWAFQELRRGVPLRRTGLERRFGVRSKTAKRDLANLAKRGLIEFVRTPRPGHYRLKSVPSVCHGWLRGDTSERPSSVAPRPVASKQGSS